MENVKFDRAYQERLEERLYRQGLQLKDEGRQIIGLYCSFAPKELIMAAGAVPVSLCAGSASSIEEAEVHLPRLLCPLIKSSYGFALSGACRYFVETDALVADTTCDGKKKMFELLADLRPLHLLKIPQSGIGPDDLDCFKQQLVLLRDWLANRTGRPITDDDVSEQIRRRNRFRQALLGVYNLNMEYPAVMSGLELDNITCTDGFEWELEERIRDMEAAGRVLISRRSGGPGSKDHTGRPRLLLTGCPTANRKILEIAEDRGGLVVAMENCGGLKTIGPLVDETKDPMTALAERYLSIACPCMTPNRGRLDLIGRIVRDYHIDGVIDLTWESCQLYDVESHLVRNHVTHELDRPYLQVRTDYSESDQAQIGVRIEAFLEMLA